MRAINADLLEGKYRLMYDAETENQVMAVADFTIDQLPTIQTWQTGEPTEDGEYLVFDTEEYFCVDTYYTHNGTEEYGSLLAYKGWQGCHRVEFWMKIPDLPEKKPARFGEWTLCKDQMPPLGVDVIVAIWGSDLIICKEGETVEDAVKRVDNEVRYTTIAQYVRDRDLDGNEWMDWFGADGFPMIVKPVAWMPMPEPYMGVKHDN